MEIILYNNFEKRGNSTKVPSVAGTSFACKLLDTTSVLAPVITIEKKDNVNIYSYTYARISDFNRYYFITDISTYRNLWIVKMSVDVLASYRHDIRNSEQYVLRSSEDSDNDIVDGIYPTISRDYIQMPDGTYESAFSYNTLTPLPNGTYQIYRRSCMPDISSWSTDRTYFKKGLSSGGYILGLVSDNGTGNTYYAMTKSSLVTFLNKILTLTPSDFTDVSSGVARAVFNGLQYITSIRWFPALPTRNVSLSPYETNIKVAGQDVNVSGLNIWNIANGYIEEFYFDIDIPRHPKRVTDEYGVLNWLTLSPYSQYNLYFAPFGNIPIDSTKIMYASTLRVQWMIDFCTGNTIMKLLKGSTGNEIVYTSISSLGVNLPVSSLVVHNALGVGLIAGYLGLKQVMDKPHPLTSAITSAWESMAENPVGAVDYLAKALTDGSLFTDFMGALGFKETREDHNINTAIDMGIDAIASALGQVQTQGQPDSFLAYYEIPIMYAWFLDIPELDIDRFGKPLNKIKTLASISGGFCKCADSNIEFDDALPTLSERNRVNSMLNTGIYLE